MFAIKRGRVAILVGDDPVDILGDEEIFGEMALLEHATRAAAVVTLEETELVEIDKPQFYILVRQNPHFALQLDIWRRRVEVDRIAPPFRIARGNSARYCLGRSTQAAWRSTRRCS
jgi:CRP-like cAMP-binding protein